MNAKIERIEAFSGHGDYNEMLGVLNCQNKSQIKKVSWFTEISMLKHFTEKGCLRKDDNNIEIPAEGDEFEL